jgi:hypothetical protein
MAPVARLKPNTRAVVLDGLRQGLQGRIAQLYNNLTLAGETNTQERAKLGIKHAIEAYEKGWDYLHEITEDDDAVG